MKVSVCIPTYNQGIYLEQAIRSAARQTHLPYEIIVSDDCSTDDTFEILQRLALEISFLKVVQQPQNIGIKNNVDISLRLATGDFIVRLDSDDYLSPDYVKVLGEQLLKYPKAGYAHAAVQEIDFNGIFKRNRRLFRKSGLQSSNDALKSMIKGYRVAANIIMFRKEALIKVNYLSACPNHGEDFCLAFSICAAGFGNVYLDETLAFYRVWEDANRTRNKRKLAEISGIRQIFEELIEPTYLLQGWNSNHLWSSKTDFACQYADCLEWEAYSVSEKKAILHELRKLSSAPRARMFFWLYLKGFGKPLSLFSEIKISAKSVLKNIFTRLLL